MKKLALALVCLVSVAFFASCTPEVQNPEPSIAVFVGSEGYLYDGAIVDVNVDYPFAFRAASNAQTQKDLATFKIYIDDELQLDSIISGKEFEFTGTFAYEFRDEIIDQTVIKAVVTDVAGKMNTATINLKINRPAIPLETIDFEWTKVGHNVMDLASYGLKWHENNWKSPYTHIYAADGYKLYVRNGDDFATITNSIELENYYNAILEQGIPADEQYNRVDCNASADYNDMLVTVNEATGEIQLIHVTRADISTPSQGTKIIISGQCK
ncbi:MAG: hypothetical protein IKO23_11170 [Bacteroidales bacterium]|jgi:hypothetical protein|nr:hypothetical protein [Bacteroidales bacterium]